MSLQLAVQLLAVAGVTCTSFVFLCRETTAIREYRRRTRGKGNALTRLQYTAVNPEAVRFASAKVAVRGFPTQDQLPDVQAAHILLYRQGLRDKCFSVRLASTAFSVGIPLFAAAWVRELVRVARGAFLAAPEKSNSLALLTPAQFRGLAAVAALVGAVMVPAAIQVLARYRLKMIRRLIQSYSDFLNSQACPKRGSDGVTVDATTANAMPREDQSQRSTRSIRPATREPR